MAFLIPLNPGQYQVDCGDGLRCVIEIRKQTVNIVKTCKKHEGQFMLGEPVNCLYEVKIHSLEKLIPKPQKK